MFCTLAEVALYDVHIQFFGVIFPDQRAIRVACKPRARTLIFQHDSAWDMHWGRLIISLLIVEIIVNVFQPDDLLNALVLRNCTAGHLFLHVRSPLSILRFQSAKTLLLTLVVDRSWNKVTRSNECYLQHASGPRQERMFTQRQTPRNQTLDLL